MELTPQSLVWTAAIIVFDPFRQPSRASAFLATMKTIQKIGARYLQHFRNPLQKVSSGGSNGMREIKSGYDFDSLHLGH